LKNISQWEGNGKDDIPYMKWKIKAMFETTNQKRSGYEKVAPSQNCLSEKRRNSPKNRTATMGMILHPGYHHGVEIRCKTMCYPLVICYIAIENGY